MPRCRRKQRKAKARKDEVGGPAAQPPWTSRSAFLRPRASPSRRRRLVGQHRMRQRGDQGGVGISMTCCWIEPWWLSGEAGEIFRLSCTPRCGSERSLPRRANVNAFTQSSRARRLFRGGRSVPLLARHGAAPDGLWRQRPDFGPTRSSPSALGQRPDQGFVVHRLRAEGDSAPRRSCLLPRECSVP